MQGRLEEMIDRWRQTIHATRTVSIFERKQPLRIDDKWLLAMVLGLGGALAGPYGTFFTLNFWERVAYWEISFVVSFAIWRLAERLIAKVIKPSSFIALNVSTIPVFALANTLFLFSMHRALEVLEIVRIPAPFLGLLIGHSFMSVTVVLPAILIVRRMKTGVQSEAGGEAIRFLTERLPPKLKGEKPFALSAEGHYVRVHTVAGDEMITMRFEDALSAVVGINGVQTHRSWWVAVEEVTEIRKVGSAYQAVLKSGLAVPVGRRRKPAVARALVASNSSARLVPSR